MLTISSGIAVPTCALMTPLRSLSSSSAAGTTLKLAAIGVITFELHIEDAHSLKDKRHYVKGLKDRLRSKFNVAVAEIGDQDVWQHGLVAAVSVLIIAWGASGHVGVQAQVSQK